MTQRSKRWLARLIFLAGFCCLFVGLCEIFVRVCFGRGMTIYPRFHEEAAYGPYKIRRLRPNTTFLHRSVDGQWQFRINQQGFRDELDYAYAKKPGVVRVLCLGDSQTQGFECAQEATYARVLERYARARGMEMEVLNSGVSGFGTAEQLVFLENEGVRYRPDVVVVGFFANDPEDSVKCGLFQMKDGALVTNKLEHLPGVRVLRPFNDFFVTRWASQHSYVYSLVLNWGWAHMKNRRLRQSTEAVQTEYAIGQVPADQVVQAYQEQLTGLLLKRLHAFCRTNGMELIIVDIPSRVGPLEFQSSVPPNLAGLMTVHSDRVLWSTNLFADYQHTVGLFVPHGQWHIWETAHAQIGIALGKEILSKRPGLPAGRSSAGAP